MAVEFPSVVLLLKLLPDDSDVHIQEHIYQKD